jgi:ABC-type tungstate transport system substrate-binding protein
VVALIWDGLRQAVWLLVGLDREVLGITWLSLYVARTSTTLVLLLGISRTSRGAPS